MFDIIGDVHGCSKTLKALLETLGYQKHNGKYQHKNRKALFLGDLIYSGPGQRETVEIVRSMCEGQGAECILGNHEFNAVAFYTPDGQMGYLRPRTESNCRQHGAFLSEHESDPLLWHETIQWFKTLPLWIEKKSLRAIHACWDATSFSLINHYPEQGRLLSESLLRDATQKDHESYCAVESLLKGKEVDLPNGYQFKDRYDIERNKIRIRWWDDQADTYHKAFFGPHDWHDQIPHEPIEQDLFSPYGAHEKPIFFGHYWRSGKLAPLEANMACLDYSVARKGEKLAAYRWSGEHKLDHSHFVAVARID